MTDHRTGTREEWQAARDELLAMEKELTRRSDALAQKRRALPWVPIEKEYMFATKDGPRSLAQLFDGRSQLLIYHFMFGPPYEAGCPVCSSIADTINGVIPHLNARDVTMVFMSDAPLDQLGESRVGTKQVQSWIDFHIVAFLVPLLEGSLEPLEGSVFVAQVGVGDGDVG